LFLAFVYENVLTAKQTVQAETVHITAIVFIAQYAQNSECPLSFRTIQIPAANNRINGIARLLIYAIEILSTADFWDSITDKLSIFIIKIRTSENTFHAAALFSSYASPY
jgi:hypothetical protein